MEIIPINLMKSVEHEIDTHIDPPSSGDDSDESNSTNKSLPTVAQVTEEILDPQMYSPISEEMAVELLYCHSSPVHL